MLLNLFGTLRNTGVPCTLREFLDLLAGLEKQLAFANSEDFYYLSRATLVKDEKHYDKFDRAFDIYFKGLETLDDIIEALVPEDWLRKEFEKFLDKLNTVGVEDLKVIESVDWNHGYVHGEEFDAENEENTINLLNRFIEESEISLDKNRVKELIGGLYNKACEVDECGYSLKRVIVRVLTQ